MAVTPKVRFEVFKRDNFTCRYCGRKTPEVVLEVDHVVPVAEGGTDDMDNLVTACWECNRGKGKTLLGEVSGSLSLHDQTVLMLERELQLREYNAIKERIRKREDEDIDELISYWDELADGHARQFPSRHSLRHFLRRIPKEDIKDAMDIAMEEKGDWAGVRYLYGILWNWVRDRRADGLDDDGADTRSL